MRANCSNDRAARALRRVVFAAAWAIAGSGVSNAQDAPETIASVRFTGLKQTSEAYAREVAGVHAGMAADRAAFDEAVARLLRTGRFADARYEVEKSGSVVFALIERTVVTSIRFEGNKVFRESTLKAELTQKIGEPLDLPAVREAREAMLEKYREAGHAEATIEVDEAAAAATGAIVFQINEGEKTRVREIIIEGNSAFGREELVKLIETKTAFWIIRSGAFDVDRAEGDAAKLQNFYRDEGFLDATVRYRTQVSESGRDLTVIFTINEGSRYAVEHIEFQGNTVFASEELFGFLKSRIGEVVRRPQVDQDAVNLRNRYGELGYIYVRVRAVRVFADTPGLVRITFEIEEGEQFRVGRVVVRGNTRTRDKVVRRALDLYPPDDLFNLTAAREAEKQLVESRVFSSARVIPAGDEPGVRDAIIDVVEAEKAGDFLFGVGVTSNSGIVGSIVLDMQNFDLWDPPRDLTEFFKLRSFFGGGQRLRLELLPGTEVSRFRIDYTQPYLLDKPIRFDWSGFLFERDRDGYNESRMGTTSSLGKRFERGRLQGWSGEIALRNEMVEVDDVDLLASNEIREDEGDNLIVGIKGSLVRDRTDNRFVPTTGDRLRISYEQVVGDHNFGRVGVAYNWYTTISTDRLDRNSVLALRGEGGWILGDAPVFERFYAGGIGSIRGFEYRGIGERDGIDDNNVGGDYLILAGAEYSYPLYGENLRGHIFLDTGTAGSGSYRAAIGTGVRFTLNLFGPVPLEFNLAMPIARDSDDDEQVFSFVVGRIF